MPEIGVSDFEIIKMTVLSFVIMALGIGIGLFFGR